MGNIKLKLLLLIALLWLVTGCSSVEHQLITKDSTTSRDNSLIVMGIKWVEVYNDAEEEAEQKDTIIKKLFSYQLLDDNKLITEKRVRKGSWELHRPLHYLYHFEFIFTDGQDKKHSFVRFDKDLRQYQHYGIYEFDPGTYRLNAIDWDENRYYMESGLRWPETAKRFSKSLSESFGTWTLQSGKIAYLGEITIRYYTKRFIYGLITPIEVVKKINLLEIEVEDKYQETVADFQQNNPWFPAQEMENLSTPGKWTYREMPEQVSEIEGKEKGGNDDESVKTNKDKNAFF